MNGIQQIEVARDRRTRFPVVRLRDKTPYVSLLPVTKLQVEQWIWEGGLSDEADPFTTTWLVDRMEHIEWSASSNKYPEKVQQLVRVPISQCTHDNLPSIVATNLSLWSSDEETQHLKMKYPTPSSEWGRLMRWLGGHVPGRRDWSSTKDSFARYRTRDLIHGILQLDFSWPPAVQCLLNKLLELVADDEMGLPLMSLGVYELVDFTKTLQRFTVTPTQTISRPFVAGSSAIWPTLESEHEKWRFVLYPTLPVVTIRPWYQESHVMDEAVENVFQVPALPLSAPIQSPGATNKIPRSPNGYFNSRVTMANRCPICYGDVPPRVFNTEGGLFCYEEGEDGKRVRRHSQTKPPREAGTYSVEAVRQEYLTVARKMPQKIRSICFSGFSKSGKTVGLLSLWGLISYPSENPDLRRVFPADWNLYLAKCSLLDFIKGETLINIERQTERMWTAGELPVRTAALRRALRCPLLFETKRREWILKTSARQIIFSFNDLAGELLTNPTDFPGNEFYPNLNSTTDVVFFTPAPEIATAAEYLDRFSAGLGTVDFEGKVLDLKKINLILAITQIDKLKHSSDPDHEELLNILLREPCTLPRDQRETELRDYLATMHRVHFDLHAWLDSKAPNLLMYANRFASVRYCGFSACGFQPVNETLGPNVEAWLPFGPKPIRIADPLLWLLHDNGLISF